MSAERLIAGRIRFSGKMAVVAIAVSFFIMIVAVAVSAGFRKEIRDGLAKVSGDVVLSCASFNYLGESDPVASDSAAVSSLMAIEGVNGITPAVYRAGIVKSGEDICGVLVKGIPTKDTLSLQVSIPRRLATTMRLSEGDDMLTYFIGEKVKARRFVVGSVYDSPVEVGDRMTVYASIDDMRRLNGWSSDEASVMEVSLDDRYRTRNGMRLKAREMGENYVAQASSEKFSQLFDWLDLIDFNVIAILLLMTVVAGFNMISGLLILLFKNISTIGLLKSMGMSDRSISKLFMMVSARLVAVGMAIGNVAALAFCLVQNATHLIRLNPENYFVSFVPVKLNLPAVLAADSIAFAAILLLLLIPVRFISKVDPALTVRAE